MALWSGAALCSHAGLLAVMQDSLCRRPVHSRTLDALAASERRQRSSTPNNTWLRTRTASRGVACCGGRVVHHVNEFLEIDLAIAVIVRLPEDLRDALGILGLRAAPHGPARVQHVPQLLLRDLAVAVLIENVECSLQDIIENIVPPLGGRSQECGVVDGAVSLGIERVHNLLQIPGHILYAGTLQALADLADADEAVAIDVELSKSLLHGMKPLVVEKSPSDDLQRSLFQKVLRLVNPKSVHQLNSPGRLHRTGLLFAQSRGQPIAAQGLRSADAFRGREAQEPTYKLLCLRGNTPTLSLKGESA
mmetsp:Transcript_92096/g.296278  ORF Transcript_92096/g.296278 Transcript_92096/m.296278 type:complete len:306 (+) Transcript_92096:61-978(+)